MIYTLDCHAVIRDVLRSRQPLLQIMGSIVLTNCTSRKSQGARVGALGEWAWTSVSDAARQWLGQVQEVRSRGRAASVYQGRSVQQALECSRRLNAELWFASAGLGLVHSESQIPRYDLTLASGQAAIGPRLRVLSASPSDWWSAVTAQQGLSLAELIARQDDGAVYIALPSTYLSLISGELELLAHSDKVERLWIFTGAPGQRILPKSIRQRALPYDRRLELIGPSGTQADFPQRCLTHFIGLGLSPDTPVVDAAAAVDAALAIDAIPARHSRRSASDAEIAQLIGQHWQDQFGQSGRLLRYLRADLGIACEQSRFRQLYHRVRDAIALEKGPQG